MHEEILNTAQRELLPLMKRFAREYYLVGGTAIALQIGHRRSIDFDMFKQSAINHKKTLDKITEAGFETLVTRRVFEQMNLLLTEETRLLAIEEEINAMTTKLLLKQQRIQEERRCQEEQEAKDKGEEPPKPKAEDPDAAEFTDTKGRKHKGILKIDATCADAGVRYPVDATLLETSCRKIDEYTSKVCQEFGINKVPIIAFFIVF